MARVIDTMRALHFQSSPRGALSMRSVMRLFKNRPLDELIADSQVILATNVAEYFVASMRDDVKEIQKHKDPLTDIARKTDDFIYSIPALAPPFQRMFIEYQMPASFFDVFENMKLHGTPNCCLLVDAAQVQKPSDNVRWVLRSAMYVEPIPRQVVGPIFLAKTLVKPTGSVFKNVLCLPRETKDEVDGVTMIMALSWLITPAMLTIGFMNCKNVTVKTEKPYGSVPAKYKRRPSIPYTEYKILDIRPMKQVLRSEGRSEETGLRKALHICRGHFKTFDKDGQLFGNIEGTFWWGNHVRGQAQARIVKDYQVMSPKKAS